MAKRALKKNCLIDYKALRTFLDFSFIVSSGYRCPNHPIEAKNLSLALMLQASQLIYCVVVQKHIKLLPMQKNMVLQALALIKKVIVGLFTWILQIIQKKNQDLLFGVIKWQERL